MSKGNRAQYTLEFKMRSELKRLLLGLMLLMIATAASAEWTIAGGNATADSYVDRATIRRNGNFVKMWNLMDYKTVKKSVAGKSYLSEKQQAAIAGNLDTKPFTLQSDLEQRGLFFGIAKQV